MKNIAKAVWRYVRQTDLVLFAVTLLACAYGFILVYSATHGSHSQMLTQVVGIAIGLVGMIVISRIDYHEMGNLWKYVAVAGVILLLLPYVHPHTVKGSADLSWLKIGGMTVQPAEIVKILFVVTFSKHYDMVKDKLTSPVSVLTLCLHALVPIGIIVIQQDMGMALVFILMFVSMMFAAGVQMRYFSASGVLLLISAPFLWKYVIGNTQRNRILALFDPAKYPNTSAQQTAGVSAIGSGEMWGYGLFHGPKTQSPIAGLLPERKNDMIFAVAGEELGFIGCILIFALVLMLLVKVISDSRRARDPMGAMICVGIFSSFAVQIIINLGMAMMVLPVIGISLPFFSSGGSSIVSSFWAVGLVLSVFMHRKTSLFVQDKE